MNRKAAQCPALLCYPLCHPAPCLAPRPHWAGSPGWDGPRGGDDIYLRKRDGLQEPLPGLQLGNTVALVSWWGGGWGEQ